MQVRNKIFLRLILPLILPLLIWIIHIISYIVDFYPYYLGILPREISGLVGIITSPLIHGDFSHLISNTAPLIILGVSIFYFYPNSAYFVFVLIYVGTGFFVWIFGREVYHIGASGVVYGFASFLFFSGIFKRDNKSIGLSLLVVFLYGSLVWGVFPGMKGISWESHLIGGIVGLIVAFFFRKVDPPRKYDWEDEEEIIPKEKLEISYDADKNKFLKE